MRLRPLAPLLVLASTTVAQAVRWQLPDRGGAAYTRQLSLQSKIEPAGTWTPEVWFGEQQPGTVLAGELDPSRQRLALPPWDIRDLACHLALDLTQLRASKPRIEMTHGGRFQPVRIEATYGVVGPDGVQAFSATIEPDTKAARGEGAPPPEVPRLQGRLQGTRTVDRSRGLVLRIDASADLVFDFPAHDDGNTKHPARRQQVQLQDRWSDPVVLCADDGEFKSRVTQAIRRSTDFLKQKVEEHTGAEWAKDGDPYHDIQPGELALMLLAIRRGGEDPHDPVLVRGFERLRKCIIEGTYSLAVAILAVESLHTPPGEWAEMRAGRIKGPMPRALPPADLEAVREWTKRLLDNVDSTVDAAYLRRWHYGPSTSWDNSNTQYALLGLYGAQLCGVDISPQVWTAAANHWLRCAIPSGEPDFAVLTSHKDLEKATRTRPGTTRLQPRAWGYQLADPTGSMTAAGITGLTLCSSALRVQKKGNPKLLTEVDDAVRAGFLWFQQNLSVRRNPGHANAWQEWRLYYLYGLERACELNQLALLGGRDWYLEGALQLLGSQREDGSWGSWRDTAFGLLFLKKAALPAITGR
jgi:hypothetical protein